MALGPSDLQAPEKMLETAQSSLEALAEEMKQLILSQPANDLLGYFWSQLLLRSMFKPDGDDNDGKSAPASLVDLQMAMEYLHAVWACHTTVAPGARLDEAACARILEICGEMQMQSFLYCLATQHDPDGPFGEYSGDFEFTAKSTWTILRGNRYFPLEAEFFQYILAPHTEILASTYGADAADIATGIQEITDSLRSGHMRAVSTIQQQMDRAHEFAEAKGLKFEDARELWASEKPDEAKTTADAFVDLFRGGICSLTKHSRLPASLLEDLAFGRGENSEFYAPGPLAGTPLRTLPARIRPAILLGNEVFATDPCFIRDASYRAIQRGLIARRPDYREGWNNNQSSLAERAIGEIFANQLAGSTTYFSVYYRDTATNQWVENDCVILLDDLLIQIEAKAGANTLASPADNFNNHARAIKNLVVKAHDQCARFIRYLKSADEVPIYALRNGDYVEVARLRHSDYRLIVPIGLTIESMAPFAAMCKILPELEPAFPGAYFVPWSIEDAFVISRVLTTPASLAHYLEVRQALASISNAHIFDELDHLGAYVSRNRFDYELREQLEDATLISCDGFSQVIDDYFADPDWAVKPPPGQKLPPLVQEILNALQHAGAKNWLSYSRALLDFSSDAKENLARGGAALQSTVHAHQHRWFFLTGDATLGVWLQAEGSLLDFRRLEATAQAAAAAAKLAEVDVLVLTVAQDHQIIRAIGRRIKAVSALDQNWQAAQTQAARMVQRQQPADAFHSTAAKPPSRNAACWCGSGKKYKRCHGG